MATKNCSVRPTTIFFRVRTAAGSRGKIRGYAMSVSNYACGGGAGACSGDEALANEHEYHQAQIDRRCRVCGQICKNTYTHKTHNETADDTSNTKACDREGELNAAFGIVVEQDMPHIHPTGFCNKCYSKMKKKHQEGDKQCTRSVQLAATQ